MPEDCLHLRVGLQIEYRRLLNWCKVAGLLEQESGQRISTAIGANQVLLVAVLSEIRTILEDFATLHGRYKALGPDENPGSEKEAEDVDTVQEFSSLSIKYETAKVERRYIRGMNHLISGAKDLKEIVKQPRRLQWATIDDKTFKKLLLRLQELIDYLHELLDDHQMKVLHETTKNTYLEMLQVRRSVEKLEQLFRAAILLEENPFRNPTTFSEPRRQNEDMLAGLARFKKLYQTIDEGRYAASQKNTLLEASQVVYEQDNAGNFRTEATCKIEDKDRFVWIEWKKYTPALAAPDYSEKKPPPGIVSRVQELTAVLNSQNNPKEFCTAHCLGYFDDRDRPNDAEKGRGHLPRFGFVFEKPTHAQSMESMPTSLYQLFGTPGAKKKPSLTHRIALAHKISSCLLYLHVVNWLHKGLRSDNILFFSTNEGTPDLTDPYLSGFEYSRPDTGGETTQKPEVVRKWEIYRHPDYQGEHPEARARKTFDIYSLGIILLEIAYWQSIDKIMKVNDLSNVSNNVFAGMKNRLLDTEPDILNTVEADVGDRYHGIVRKCIEGAHGFDIEYDDPETSPETGAKLLHLYTTQVVDELKSINL